MARTIEEFEISLLSVVNNASFTEDGKIDALKGQLLGTAKEVVNRIPYFQGINIAFFLAQLKERFGYMDNISSSFNDFITATRKPGESLPTFASRLEKIAEDVIRADPSARDSIPTILFHKFTAGFPDLLLQEIKRQTQGRVNYFPAVIRISMDFFEAYPSYKMNSQYIATKEYYASRGKKPDVRVNSVTQEPTIVIEEVDESYEVNAASTTGPCFSCQKPGHFARDCPTSGNRTHTRPHQKVEKKAEDKGNQGRKGRSRRPRKGKWKTMPFDGNATCKGCKKSGHTWETCFVRQRAIEEFQRNPHVNAAGKSGEDSDKPGESELQTKN